MLVRTIQHFSLWHLVLISVGRVRLFLTFSRGLLYFMFRELAGNQLDGTIPAQISALVKLQYLWVFTSLYWVLARAFQHFSFNECWYQCLSTHNVKRSAFIYRVLSVNKLDGSIPAAISTLVTLSFLYAHTSFNLMSVGHAPSLSFSRGHVICQGSWRPVWWWQQDFWGDTISDISTGQSGTTVSPHFYFT